MRTNFLRETLAKESRAYGFTIAFWGSGALLIKAHGLPSLLEALLYGSGAVLGFGILTIMLYQGKTLGNISYERSDMVSLSMVHYIAALLPIAAAHYLSALDAVYAFLLTGVATSVLYNLGMVVEEIIDEKIAEKL